MKAITGIISVGFYVASPVECCDRCSQGIKYVYPVRFKDGTFQKFGSECINKILSGDTSLEALFKKNAKLLQRRKSDLAVLSLPYDQMPIDSRGYYGRGIYFINTEKGGWLTAGSLYTSKARKEIVSPEHYFFHPTKVDQNFIESRDGSLTFDMRGEAQGTAWEANTFENFQKKSIATIEAGKAWLQHDIARLESFLARIVEKGLISESLRGQKAA